MAGLLHQQLQSTAATARMSAALVLCSWLRLEAASLGLVTPGDAAVPSAPEPVKQEVKHEVNQALKQEVSEDAKHEDTQAVKAEGGATTCASPPPAAIDAHAAAPPPPHTMPCSFTLVAALAASVPTELTTQCLSWLAAPGASAPSPPSAAPYTEAAPLYAKMRRELVTLLSACLQVRGSCWTAGFTPGTVQAGIPSPASLPRQHCLLTLH